MEDKARIAAAGEWGAKLSTDVLLAVGKTWMQRGKDDEVIVDYGKSLGVSEYTLRQKLRKLGFKVRADPRKGPRGRCLRRGEDTTRSEP